MHRPPAFGECQRDAVLEGQLRGTVCRAREPQFPDWCVMGAYRLRIDPGYGGIPQRWMAGTFEGLLVSSCRLE